MAFQLDYQRRADARTNHWHHWLIAVAVSAAAVCAFIKLTEMDRYAASGGCGCVLTSNVRVGN